MKSDGTVWKASWISCPGSSPSEYGVYHFRRTFRLDSQPDRFPVRVSADNRYRLFVNGHSVGFGPARGDRNHWRYETYDIADHLRAGTNSLAAVVWNFGVHRPNAQISLATAFLLQIDSETHSSLSTDSIWKTLKNPAYSPIPVFPGTWVGPGDCVEGGLYPWGWEEPDHDDTAWPNAVICGEARSMTDHCTGWSWGLVERNIPLMEETPQVFHAVRQCDGVSPPERFLAGENAWSVPARTKTTVLLDQSLLTTAFLKMRTSGGAGSRITLVYAEALFGPDGRKTDRNRIEGMTAKGNSDTFLPDGGNDREWATLWWRTFRYVLLTVETADSSLVIDKITSDYTGYPFSETGSFDSSDTSLSGIWSIGWRTARLCGHETYMDCPYYEQLQYVGDTRIQALISLYVAGDDRLMRNAISLIDNSRTPEGITLSNYPLTGFQIIPPFSLYWISMVHDLWMHREADSFVKIYLNGIAQVLDWYLHRIDPKTGMLGPVPHWNFVDWTGQWPWDTSKNIGGVPDGADEGGSSITTLHLAVTLAQAAGLFSHFGLADRACSWEIVSQSLKLAVRRHCWNPSKGLISDTPRGESFSQHANINAILSGLFRPSEARTVMEKLLSDASLTRCSLYYSFYLTRALVRTGMADRYLDTLDPWKDMITSNLTTFAEVPDIRGTRSDCHAWSASPNYEFLATVLGVRPASPGFRTVLVEPALGGLERASGKIPHPRGMIEVSWTRNGNRLKGDIILPEGSQGLAKRNNRSIKLKPGRNTVTL